MLSALARQGVRAIRNAPVAKRASVQVQTVRHGGDIWHYREPNLNPPRHAKLMGEGLMTFMWYWILYHLWYDGSHITGHFQYPDPSQWTDEELGIPPDDAE